jgi:peptide subunit release factor 1 (eRF1)
MNDTPAGATAPTTTDVTSKLQELARATPGLTPVISVYLDTRWADEHQRERVRVFLKNEARKAAAMAAGELDAELAWITEQGERLVRQELHPEAAGVAMFAGGPDGLRDVSYFAVPFPDTFAVADTPRLRPLVAALGEAPRAALLLLDAESARLVALTEEGAAEEVTLASTDTLGQHRRGGFLLLLQSRYQRHIHEHRARHFDAVAQALADLVDHYGLRAIVLAGEPRNLAVFRSHVPPRLAPRLVGEVAGARYEATSVLAERALELIRHRQAGETAASVETVLTSAEGGGRAVAGVDSTIEAVNRGTVDRLYLLRGYQGEGRVCPACHALQRADATACQWCGTATVAVDLGEAMVRRVIAAGGDVASVDVHAGLAQAGGVAALLRYPAR